MREISYCILLLPFYPCPSACSSVSLSVSCLFVSLCRPSVRGIIWTSTSKEIRLHLSCATLMKLMVHRYPHLKCCFKIILTVTLFLENSLESCLTLLCDRPPESLCPFIRLAPVSVSTFLSFYFVEKPPLKT